MVKISGNDALAVLRKFGRAGEEHMPRHIEQLRVSHPQPTNTLAQFRFNRLNYWLLVDGIAEDDTHYVQEQMAIGLTGVHGQLLENPNDGLMAYGMPHKGKDVYLYAELSDKKRLDVALAEQFPETSRSTWQKHIKAGHILVNGAVVTSPKTDIATTAVIEQRIPDATDHSSESIPIVYIDDNVIVINKPVGMLTHAKGELNDEFTVADFFRRYSNYHTDTNRPGIVHRLDRDTSGIMIGARNDVTAKLLQKQFADRKTKKVYKAVLKGMPKQNAAVIDLPIGRNPSAPSTFRVDSNGKSAQTSYQQLATDGKYTYVELRPKTGRTHQLRVHMAYLGTPIKGDRVYGKESDRLYLHAESLEITIPQGDRRVFTAPVPEEFAASIEE